MKIKISKKAERFLKKQLKNTGIEYIEEDIIKQLNDILYPYNDKIPPKLTIIIEKGNVMGASNTSYFGPPAIHMNSRYVFEYLTQDNKDFYSKCIIQVIGHELGHNRVNTYVPFLWILKDFKVIPASKKDKTIARLIEIYCDHYSIEFSGLSIHEIKEIMKKKVEIKGRDTSNYKHPFWSEREVYIESKLDESLIWRVAKDNNYNNQKVINKLIDYFRNVKKYDGYILKKELIFSYIRLLTPIAIIAFLAICISVKNIIALVNFIKDIILILIK